MKKITSMVFSVLFVLLVTCNSIYAYNIRGEMGSKVWDGKQVTLLKGTKESGMIPVDSVVIKDGVFKLTGKQDTAGWCALLINKGDGESVYKDFYPEGSLLFAIKDGKPSITGSPVNNAYQVFVDKYEGMTANLMKFNEELKAHPENTELEKAFNDELSRYEKAFSKLAVTTVLGNLNNPLGLYLFKTTMSTYENKDFEAIFAKAGPDFLTDPVVKMAVSQLAQSKKSDVGSRFPDLAMSKPDGLTIALSEYVGKGSYVLIDFWASWCAPCMRELPNLMTCYEKYHQKGFEIVGVSLDTDANAWNIAIRQNRIPWPQMSDFAGWQTKAVEAYSFSSIPHTVLVDPKGIIIAKDLRGVDLENKLAELLGE